ncbi:MAG: PD40 domain-containing protein, partial [Anaerolineales bacterium]|nr:PD40 domain-containing protein [Anaerolineales bacterium]
MSKNAYLMIINGSLLLILLGWLMSHAGQTEAIDLPGPAFGTTTATHLSLVTYPHENTQFAVTVAKTLDEQGRANTTSAVQTINSAAIPQHCQISSTHVAPNGQYLIWQYNCEASLFVKLQNLHETTTSPETLSRGYFLAWSPDSNWFLFREIDTDQIQLISVANTDTQPLDLPFGTYNATFTPDGQSVLFAANKGLGFGSTLGLLRLTDQEIVWQRQFPQQIVAFPSWSPDASQMAYIFMAPSNVPFTPGQLRPAPTSRKPPNSPHHTAYPPH